MAKEKIKEEKKKPFSYQILNIKLLSNERKGNKAYEDIITSIFEKSLTENIPRGKVVILRNQFKSEINGDTILYGKISRFTQRESKDWINLETKEVENPVFAKNLYPNLQETDYVFVPAAHRFIVKSSKNFSIFNAEKFFRQAIPRVINATEDFDVIIEQSTDIFKEIYEAPKVEKLCISISYTNSDDIGKEAAEWMDEQLKEAHLLKADFNFKSTDSINLETKLVKGALDLAAENGSAIATIVNISDKREIIKTIEHPKVVKSTAKNDDDIKKVIFTEVMNHYRNNENIQ